MSRMIECDGCKSKMYEDRRTGRDEYHEIWIDRSSSYHLCAHCFVEMMAKVFHMHYDEEEGEYVDD